MDRLDRRTFLSQTAGAGLAMSAQSSILSTLASAAEQPRASNTEAVTPTFVAFTESFQGWPIPKVCEKFKAIGLDGLDLTVRPGGHIDPADAEAKLPAAAKAARQHALRIAMLTTAIAEADKQSEALLAAAAEAGIDRVKLGYYRYEKFGTLAKRIDDVRKQLAGVVKIAAKHGVLPCVHVHSGDTIPASGFVAYMLVKDFSPRELGAYVDPMHMTLEGGNDGWRQGLDLLAPWIAISSLKNFQWLSTDRDAQGQRQWTFRKCPLADGVAPIPKYLAALSTLGYRGLFTLHSEYCDRNSWKVLNADECLQQTREDLTFAKKVIAT
jgi:sugar phosphate isomerase/epimerase